MRTAVFSCIGETLVDIFACLAGTLECIVAGQCSFCGSTLDVALLNHTTALTAVLVGLCDCLACIFCCGYVTRLLYLDDC